MCLLLHRPEGVEIPARLVKSAGRDNPHGWGIMVADGSRIRTWRGMRMDAIHKAMKAVGSAECVIHWRMATHGTTDLANCHPFEFEGGMYGLAHNGIIGAGLAPIVNPRRSDTWHFAHNFVAPALRKNPALHGNPEWVGALADAVGARNKIAILRADGALDIVNRSRGVEWEGLWMSNDYSLPVPDRSGLRGGLMEWDDASETWQDATNLGWGPDDECSDLDALANLPLDDIAEWCERDPYWVAGMIRAYFRSDRRRK